MHFSHLLSDRRRGGNGIVRRRQQS
jgi:hypothetical protein